MKKTLSVVLALLVLISGFTFIAFAEDDEGFKAIYTVRVADSSADMINVVGVYGKNEVVQGDTFYFTIDYLRNYRPDETTVIKAYPASYPADFVVTYEDSTEIITLTPDPATGLYSIPNVQEDWYVAAFSLQESGFASLKDMLFRLFNAIIEFFRNLFNIAG